MAEYKIKTEPTLKFPQPIHEVENITEVTTAPLTNVREVRVINLSPNDFDQVNRTYRALYKIGIVPDALIRDALIKHLGYQAVENRFVAPFPDGDPNQSGGVKFELESISSYQVLPDVERLLADPSHANGLVLSTQAIAETGQPSDKMVELTVILKKTQDPIESVVDTSQLLS